MKLKFSTQSFSEMENRIHRFFADVTLVYPQAVIVVYGFSRPFLLNEHIQLSENQAYYRRHILEVIMKVPIMCFFAGIFSFIFFQLVSVTNL